jgi:hypothetical protein
VKRGAVWVLTEPLEEVVDLLPHAQRAALRHLEGLLRIAYLLRNVMTFLTCRAALRQLERLPRVVVHTDRHMHIKAPSCRYTQIHTHTHKAPSSRCTHTVAHTCYYNVLA